MIEPGRCPFAQKTLPVGSRIIARDGTEDLNGNWALQHQMPASKDCPIPAGAQLALQSVLAVQHRAWQGLGVRGEHSIRLLLRGQHFAVGVLQFLIGCLQLRRALL